MFLIFKRVKKSTQHRFKTVMIIEKGKKKEECVERKEKNLLNVGKKYNLKNLRFWS
jgi:hypothetical protein